MRLLSNLLRRFIRQGTLRVRDTEGKVHVFGGRLPGPDVAIHLHDSKLYTKLFVNPELYAAEAYMDGQLTLENGAASVALIPTRYPGTDRETDSALRLARATDWREQPGGAWHGVGQRMLTTDQAEIALLDVRVLSFDTVLVESAPAVETSNDG